VGAVFALEASRLSRSCSDWHRLLEICALTATLLVDEDGCYNPADFNDQLLLGLKGTMSQAELHFIRARLQGGKRNKAQRGELRFPLPVGYVYGEEPGSVLIDPDQEVRRNSSLNCSAKPAAPMASFATSLNTIYAFLSGPMAGFGTANCFGAP
jgi:DNA invertase Pin-like site-specific DNA recombinase